MVAEFALIDLTRLLPGIIDIFFKMADLTKELRSRRLWVEVLAEFLASTLFISIVCGCSLSYTPPSSVMHMSISSGLGVATFAFTMWDVSSGLFNPALTIAYLIARKKTLAQTVLYIIAQLAGGVCGAAMIYGVASDKAIRDSNLAVNLRNPDVSVGQALGMEIWIGFILTLVVFSATDPGRTKLAGYGPPLAIGFMVFVNLNMSIPISGGGMNPARSFGPAVIMNSWQDHWIYWLGPVVGSVCSALLYHYVFAQRTLKTRPSAPEPQEGLNDGLQYVNEQISQSTSTKL